MEQIFNPCCEFRWSPDGPVSQIHSPPSWCPWVLFISFKVSSDARESAVREATAPIKSLIKLQPSFLSLQRKTCLRQNYSQGSCACREGPVLGQNSLMIYIYIYIYIWIFQEFFFYTLWSNFFCNYIVRTFILLEKRCLFFIIIENYGK